MFGSGYYFKNGSGGGSGTVTSVGLSAPNLDFTVANSPITTNGTLSLSWLDGILHDFIGNNSVDFYNHQLYDDANVIAIQYSSSQRLLYDALGFNSIEYNSRYLLNAGGLCLDWGSSVLSVAGISTLDWGNHTLNVSGFPTLDWLNKQLLGSGSITTATWNDTTFKVEFQKTFESNDNVVAPAANAGVIVLGAYIGANNAVLTDPVDWLPFVVNGTLRKIPCYA